MSLDQVFEAALQAEIQLGEKVGFLVTLSMLEQARQRDHMLALDRAGLSSAEASLHITDAPVRVEMSRTEACTKGPGICIIR